MVQIIKIALAIIFGLAAVAKFSGKTRDSFQKLRYGIPLMYATALAEVLFSVGLFTPYDLLAAIGLSAIILGAIFTLAKDRVAPVKYVPAVLSLILLLAVVVVRMQELQGSLIVPNHSLEMQ